MEKFSLKKAVLAQAIRQITANAPKPVLEMAYEPMPASLGEGSNIVYAGFSKNITTDGNELYRTIEHLNLELISLDEDNFHKVIDLGSIVFTNKGNFFVGAESSPVDVNGFTIIGISTHNPLFAAMQGKKRGEQFNLQKEIFRIWDVF